MRFLTILSLILASTFPAWGAGTTDNTFKIGKGASNKEIIFDHGAGATNPRMRWNESASKIEFTHDGTNYNVMGADSGPATAISAVDIDWSAGPIFTKTLSANTTFTFSNVTSPKTIIVRVTNTASNYTVTWPAAAKWGNGGTPPTQTVGAKADVYTFVYDGTTIFSSVVQDFTP